MTTGYCTVTDLQNLTGSKLDAGVLQAIIDDACREVDVYLGQFSLGGNNGPACKSATIKFATAGLITRMRMDGTKGTSRSIGDYTLSDDPDGAIEALKIQAFALLDQYVRSQLTLPNTHRSYVVRVN